MFRITLHILSTEALNPDDKSILALMSSDRKLRISRLIPEKAKRESCGAELLLCYALRDLYVPPLFILRTERGKPYIANCRLQFSLAHSDGMAVCAVCDAEVGVDAEKKRDLSERMQRRIMSPEDVCKSPIHVWSAKEAFVKLTGEGIGRTSLHDMQTDGESVSEQGTFAHLWQAEFDDMVYSVCAYDVFEVEIKRLTVSEILSALR